MNEFLEQAVRLLHEQEDWLSMNRTTIAKLVEAGWESADRGELRGEAEVKADMGEKKRAWIALKRSE